MAAVSPAREEEIDEYLLHTKRIGGNNVTIATKNPRYPAFDPNFFDEDYSVEAKTGFQLWEGTYGIISLLDATCPAYASCPLHLDKKLKGRRVIELGGGTGLLGLSAASVGAHVMITDLTALVQHINDNIKRNIINSENGSTSLSPADTAPGYGPWPGAKRVGYGTVTTSILDWLRPESWRSKLDELSTSEFIIAADVVWLLELVQPFVDVVTAILGAAAARQRRLHVPAGSVPGADASSEPPTLYLSYCDRGRRKDGTGHNGGLFTYWEQVQEAFERSKCVVKEVFRIETSEKKGMYIMVFEITLAEVDS
eukprot:jgi/Mesvir1/25934/Mv20928-RA.1